MIRINGALGEGGGQILRTSLSLALVSRQPFRIENIRAGRARPGLLRQHLTAVEAAAAIGGARVEGAALGSLALEFHPGQVRAGDYHFAVGTAGSAMLVLQTVLPPLMLGTEPSTLLLEGGTHNPAAPPFDYLARVFLPLLARMGPRVEMTLERYGFYPAGGGRVRVSIQPVRALKPLELGERGPVKHRRVVAVVAHVPGGVAVRETSTVMERLGWTEDARQIIQTKDSAGPGNVVMVEVGDGEQLEMFTAFGERGVPAESVASEAARDAREYLVSRAGAGEHLTDQLLLPLTLAGGGSFHALKLNRHARTNIEVIGQFLPVRFTEQALEGSIRVSAGAA